jgi:hypothetical protein
MERTMLTEDVKTLISLANLSAYRKILNIREGEAVSEDYDSFTQVQVAFFAFSCRIGIHFFGICSITSFLCA